MEGRRLRRWAAGLVAVALLESCAGGGASPAPTSTSAAPASVAGPSPIPTIGPTPAPASSASPSFASPTQAEVREMLDVPYAKALTSQAKDASLDIYLPATQGRRPVVIWGHGGEQGKINGIGFARKMAAQGAIVLVPDIPHGASTNDEPLGIASRALFEVADCAVRMARSVAATRGGDPDRVIWSGYSFGGVVGFEHALTDPGAEQAWDAFVDRNGGPARQYECVATEASVPLTALVTSGSVRMIDKWPDTYAADATVRTFVDSINRIGNNPGLKVRQVQGTADLDVPLEVAERLNRELRAAGYDATLVPLEGVSHLPNDDEVVAEIVKILGD